MSLVLDVNGLSIRMAHSLRKTPTCEGRGGRLPSCRDSCSTRSLQPETELPRRTHRRLAVRRWLPVSISFRRAMECTRNFPVIEASL
jgi:hypothetical protein